MKHQKRRESLYMTRYQVLESLVLKNSLSSLNSEAWWRGAGENMTDCHNGESREAPLGDGYGCRRWGMSSLERVSEWVSG